MKTIFIPDIHGRNIWKYMIQQSNPDTVIFLGDYFDSYDIPSSIQLSNLTDIIDFKNTNTKINVHLLIGNHDYHYFPFIGNKGTSGYQSGVAKIFEHFLYENIQHFKMCHSIDNRILCSHAGISSVWLYEEIGCDISITSPDNISSHVNDLWKYKPKLFNFNGIDRYGDDVYQTPIWIRPTSLILSNLKTHLKDIIQIVGHTGQTSVTLIDNVYFTDVLSNELNDIQYVVYENEKFEIKKLEIIN